MADSLGFQVGIECAVVVGMKIKGYTVHLDAGNGQTVCGVKPRVFMGRVGLSKHLNRVTCPKCERLAKGKV